MRARIAVIVLALCAALLPISPDAVEQFYSLGVYPWLQPVLTGFSNLTRVAWFDVLVVSVTVTWLALAWRDIRKRRWTQAVWRVALRTATLAAALYLVFLATWGLNYRRVSIEDKLGVDYRAITSDAAVALTEAAVSELNRLYPSRSRGDADPDVLTSSIAGAFGTVQRELGHTRPAVPGRPKRTMLDFYFRAASIDGMTDPYFLETMTLAGLLPVERPMTVAHEWAHLAGYADEGEANFVGWLVCMDADDAARYSAWLFLYSEALSGLDRGAQARVSASLAAGPRADLAAIAARVRSQSSPMISTVGWGVYDQYLKANGVERGTRSYTDVIRLVLGTPLGRRVTDALPGRAAEPAPAAVPSPRLP